MSHLGRKVKEVNNIEATKRKICNQCEEEKSIEEYYTQNKTKANGEEYLYYNPKCRECIRHNLYQWRAENPERSNENNKRWNSTERGMKFRRDVSRRVRSEGKYREWQRNNPDKIRDYQINREQNKTHKISKYEWLECKRYFNHSCAYCGLTEEDHLKEHKQQLHKEHVIHDGSNEIVNCIPACKPCNSSKGEKIVGEWYSNSNPTYTKEREDKIYAWLTKDVFKL